MIYTSDILTVLALWVCLAAGYATVHMNLGARKRGAEVPLPRRVLSVASLAAGAMMVIFAFIYTEAWIVVLSILATTFLAAYSVGDMEERSYRRFMPLLPIAEIASIAAAVLAWIFLRW